MGMGPGVDRIMLASESSSQIDLFQDSKSNVIELKSSWKKEKREQNITHSLSLFSSLLRSLSSQFQYPLNQPSRPRKSGTRSSSMASTTSPLARPLPVSCRRAPTNLISLPTRGPRGRALCASTSATSGCLPPSPRSTRTSSSRETCCRGSAR